jgi:formate dehydrogenase major subunit
LGLFDLLSRWPVIRQLRDKDSTALGDTAMSERSRALEPRTVEADQVVPSICPYCAVGCGQKVYVKDGRILVIEGDEDSPISRGRLCPKGAATFQLVTGSHRLHTVLYRRPGASQWERIPLHKAMEMVAERVKKTRDATWEEKNGNGETVNRTLGIAGLGIVQVENQARI